jgi:plasmid segregation protein ParM
MATFGETIRVIVGNQATALINHVLYNNDGSENPDFRVEASVERKQVDGEWIEKDIPASTYGVIEVGYLTTDYTVRVGLVEVASSTSSDFGVCKAFERLQTELQQSDMDHDLNSVVSTLIEKSAGGNDYKHQVASATSNLIQQAVTTSKEAFGGRRLDGILIAGGGSSIIFDAVKKEFPKAIRLENARFAVAEGYVRRGLSDSHEDA